MNRRQETKQIAAIAIFMAVMLVIEIVSQSIFAAIPALPLKPTLTHIPVIIASIYYGPKVGAGLGTFMGIMSVVRNTILVTPASYIFSPFVDGGNFYSLLIAIVPRVLIGVTPYLIYKALHNTIGLGMAGAVGSMTNTLFVLGGIFFLFPDRFGGNVQSFLAAVLATNSLVEVAIATVLTMILVPRLRSLKH
ncbi:ECF transporter S component [Streptococcus entericus]|uniref:ECF transporter S component n=1 Tax=Streptococcus entericus TaxID=155680 RepID=UPI000368571B|nr:ECF transporter S component [Streptococcus entericus]